MKLTHFANECFFCSNHIIYFEIENKTKSCTVILNVVKLFVIKNADTIFIYLFFYIFPLCKFCVDFHTFYGAIYTKCLLFFTVIFIHLFIYFLQWVCILWMLFFIRSHMFRNVHCMIFMIYVCLLYFLNIIFPVIHVYSCYLILFWQWK